LKWNAILIVSNFGANGSDQNSDQTAVEQAIDAAAQNGGGVVFFPTGTYLFTEDLILKSGVILKGENPAVADAKDPNFRPSSKLEFPAYVFDALANGGRGNPIFTFFQNDWWNRCV
jgi:polygalacturonase